MPTEQNNQKPKKLTYKQTIQSYKTLFEELGYKGVKLDPNKPAEYNAQVFASLQPQKEERTTLGADYVPAKNVFNSNLFNILTEQEIRTVFNDTFSSDFEGVREKTENGVKMYITNGHIDGDNYDKVTKLTDFNPGEQPVVYDFLVVDQQKRYSTQASKLLGWAFGSMNNFNSYLAQIKQNLRTSAFLDFYTYTKNKYKNYDSWYEINIDVSGIDNDKDKYVEIMRVIKTTSEKIEKPLTTITGPILDDKGDDISDHFTTAVKKKNQTLLVDIETQAQVESKAKQFAFNPTDYGVGFKKVDLSGFTFNSNSVIAYLHGPKKVVTTIAMEQHTQDSLGFNLKNIDTLHYWYGTQVRDVEAGIVFTLTDSATTTLESQRKKVKKAYPRKYTAEQIKKMNEKELMIALNNGAIESLTKAAKERKNSKAARKRVLTLKTNGSLIVTTSNKEVPAEPASPIEK